MITFLISVQSSSKKLQSTGSTNSDPINLGFDIILDNKSMDHIHFNEEHSNSNRLHNIIEGSDNLLLGGDNYVAGEFNTLEGKQNKVYGN